MTEVRATALKLSDCLVDRQTTTADPRDPGHHRITLRYSKAKLKEAFGWRTKFHPDGFSYVGKGGRRTVYLVGGAQWAVTQERDSLSASCRDSRLERPAPRLFGSGVEWACVAFPNGSWAEFSMEPYEGFAPSFAGKALLRRIERIRLGSKWRPLPFSGIKVCSTNGERPCLMLSNDGRLTTARELKGFHGSARIVLSLADQGETFTATFVPDEPDAPLNKDRFFPIRVSRLADSGHPALWPLKESTFAYLTPPDSRGECEIRVFDFYDKGQYHSPLPKIGASAPFWIVPLPFSEPKFFWTAQGQALLGLSEAFSPVSVTLPAVRSQLVGLDGNLGPEALRDYRDLSPYLLNWDCSGYNLISWKPLAGDYLGPPPGARLEYEVRSGPWDLGALSGDACPDFVSFDVRGGSLLANAAKLAPERMPAVFELRVDLGSGEISQRSWPVEGLSSQGRLLAKTEGWFLFFDPTPAPRILCLFPETGYSRTITLPPSLETPDPLSIGFEGGEERIPGERDHDWGYDPILSGD